MAGMKLASRFKKLAKSSKPSKDRKDDGDESAKKISRPSLIDNSAIASKQVNSAHSPLPPNLPTLGLATPETAATALSSVPGSAEKNALPAIGDQDGGCGSPAGSYDDNGSRTSWSSGTGSYAVRSAEPASARGRDPPDINGVRSHDVERALRDRMQMEIERHRSEYEVEAEVEADPVMSDRSRDNSPDSRNPSKTSRSSAKRNIFGKLNRGRGEKNGGKNDRKISSKSYVSREVGDGMDPQEDGSIFLGVASAESGEYSRTTDDRTAGYETDSYEERSFEGSVDPPSADEENGVIARCNVLDFSSQTRPISNNGGKFASPRTPKGEHEEGAVRSPVSPFLSWLGLATPEGNDDAATFGSRGDTATYDDGTYDGTYDGTLDDDTTLGAEVSDDPRLSSHAYSPGIKVLSDPVLGGRGPASSHAYSPGIQPRSDPPEVTSSGSPGLARKHSFRLLKRSRTPVGGGEDRSQGGRSQVSTGRTDSGGGTEVTAGGHVIEQKSEWKNEFRDGNPMQMDVYCKGSGGADQLILRKYGGDVPDVGEPNHALVEIEVRLLSASPEDV